ncbi:PREDICTED: H/ACA ribonucleoprotein complex subunit 2, partial [Merops nubicus]|uniref:H/ACA ribonucleoprotein complex subunit 2 n=1 Tax=Merops nubicus TaxID=57421 RepID=UPI0004F06FA6
RRGVKEVQKFINKGEKGITVLAGDTLPIDVYCHIPIMCEDRSIPYAYVPSKSAGSQGEEFGVIGTSPQYGQLGERVWDVRQLPAPALAQRCAPAGRG